METLKEGQYYHIYNRGAGRCDLFWQAEDYELFLERYEFYLTFAVQTFAYCLLRNHFHFLIKDRTKKEQVEAFHSIQRNFPTGSFFGDHFESPKPLLASNQFSHLLNSYTKHFNKKYNRSGTLIEGPFKRIRLRNQEQFNQLICYIHRNPIHHGLTDDYSAYPYSSYLNYIRNKPTLLEQDEVLKQFGGQKNFVDAHKEYKSRIKEKFFIE